MSFSIARQIKLRSIEQANFTKSYNRVNFVVTPDGLSTDLSQSYLSMRVWLLKNISGVRVSHDEMKQLIRDNLCVSFGNNDLSYTASCLIKTARLFALKNDELLEEVNFANILTQSIMNQLCNDFETLESSNLLTGSSSQLGHGSSLPCSLSAFHKNWTEVHVFLRDIFGVCRHSNFELMATGGLRMEFELEDRSNVFKLTTLGDFRHINVKDVSGNTADAVLAERFGYPNTVTVGYLQNADTLSTSSIQRDQFTSPSSDLFIDASNNFMIQYPKEGFDFPASIYFKQPTKGDIIEYIELKDELTYNADQLTALGLEDGSFIKLRYAISSSYSGADAVQPKDFYMMNVINGIDDSSGVKLILQNTLLYPNIVGRNVDDVVTFVGLELLRANEVFEHSLSGDVSTWQLILMENRLLVDPSNNLLMKQLGLVDDDHHPTGVSFDLGVQMIAYDASGTAIVPDKIENQSSSAIRKVYSNQLTKLPAQGDKCRIVRIEDADASGNRMYHFTTWGCEAKTSIQVKNIIPTGDSTIEKVNPEFATLYIWNVQNHAMGPDALDLALSPIPHFWNDLTYEIDKFEMVLMQSSIDPKNRMPSPFVYSTWKVETATVESEQQTWSRQFILENGVYNCFLLTPRWNTEHEDKGSLISTRRGISHYRYLVNNVQQTNRDIFVQDFRTDHVSSLYLDRLNDTFTNSDYILRSPVGIKGTVESEPVVVFPLKIYHAVSETSYMLGGPTNATVQVNLFSDPSMKRVITPGNVFMFKAMLKQL